MLRASRWISISVLLTFLVPSAYGAQVAKVQGRKLLISLEGEPAQKGDIFYTIAPNGKRAGILKILKIKGDKALAVLGKGKAQPGFALEYRPPKGAQAAAPAADPGDTGPIQEDTSSYSASPSRSGSSKTYWGFLAGFAMNTMDVDLKDSDGETRATAGLSGNSFSAKGLFDYNLFDQVWFRGMGGLEGFNVSGPSECGDSPFEETCNAEINYLSIDLWGRYAFTSSSFRPWVGGGFSLLFPMTKKATALEASSITNTSIMAFGVGLDWDFSPTMTIPIQIEYGLLPESDDVSASLIAFRAGLAFPF